MTEQHSLAVRKEQLRLAAIHTRKAAENLGRTVNGATPPANHHPNTQACEALSECTAAWAAYLNGHVEDDGHHVAHTLHRTHESYGGVEVQIEADARSTGARVRDI